jgi:hypothetical protein
MYERERADVAEPAAFVMPSPDAVRDVLSQQIITRHHAKFVGSVVSPRACGEVRQNAGSRDARRWGGAATRPGRSRYWVGGAIRRTM